jgi:hypothetical protein
MKTRDQNNILVTSKHHFIEGLDPLRYAGFLRLVYKSLGINVLYRFNDVFLSGRTYSYDRNGVSYSVPRSDPSGSARYPKIGEFEFGITLML